MKAAHSYWVDLLSAVKASKISIYLVSGGGGGGGHEECT